MKIKNANYWAAWLNTDNLWFDAAIDVITMLGTKLSKSDKNTASGNFDQFVTDLDQYRASIITVLETITYELYVEITGSIYHTCHL